MKFQILTACSMLAITVQAAPLTLTCEETQAPFSLSCKEAAAATGATAAESASSTASNSTAGTATAATNSSSVLPDGRIAQGAVATDFNVLASKFKSAVVKGDGLVFSDLIEFPTVTQSLFDKAGNTKAFEITIDDKAIFIPQGGTAQSDIRRADLLPSIASTLNNIATTGVKTMHFSMQADSTKPLNLTHNYQLVFLESADFTVHQFDVKVGGAAAGANSSDITITGNAKNAAGVQTLFTTPMTAGSFENFAVKMDFDKNTIQIFHSTGDAALTQATEEVANDMTGNGEYHFAVLKNGIGGVQGPIVGKEGIIYGGIFMEDSATGTVTLQ